MKQLDLNVEVLEERIAPCLLTVAPPADPAAAGNAPSFVPNDVADSGSAASAGAPVNEAAIAAHGRGPVSVNCGG